MRSMLLPFACAVLASVPAAATTERTEQVTISVSAEGLDFARAADIATMKDRIDVAVKRACKTPAAVIRSGSVAIDECIADGTAKAMAALDAQLAAED